MSEVSCEICFNVFNDNEKIPKILECGHTLCSFCLLKIFQSKKTCPKCSKPMNKSSAEEFPTNYFILAFTPNVKAIKEDGHKDSIIARKEKIQQTVEEIKPLLNLVSSDLEKFPNQLRCDCDVKLKVADEVVLQAENYLQEAFETLKLTLSQKIHFGAEQLCTELFLKNFLDTHQFLCQISILSHQGGKVFAKHRVNGVPKYGEVALWKGDIRIYSLSLFEVKKPSTIVLFSDLQTCITERGMEKFKFVIAFCAKCICSFTPRKSNLLPFLMKFLTGEAGATFKGATFIKNGDRVNIGRYRLNGVTTQGTLDYVSYLPEGNNKAFSDELLLIGTKDGTLKIESSFLTKDTKNVIGTANYSLKDIPDSGSIVDCGLRLKLNPI